MTETANAPTTGTDLGLLPAIWSAFRSRDADFYPRVSEDSSVSTLPTPAMLAEMGEASERWGELNDDDTLEHAINLAKQSLSEVKNQTEYQDQKATRLLTITTFLSALSGALFSRFEDAYPVQLILQHSIPSVLLLIVSYLGFIAFVMSSLSGALVTFHAIRTRFKYPPKQTAQDQEEDPRSLLFYAAMIRSRPRAWVNGWVSGGADAEVGFKPFIRKDLRQRYFQHLVTETYLVATKTADKLRYLVPGQQLLALSLRCLFVWLLLLVVVETFVPAAKPLSGQTESVRNTLPTPLSSAPISKPTQQISRPVLTPHGQEKRKSSPPAVQKKKKTTERGT